MNILLLGATGYLGNNIVHKLCESGHTIICPVREGAITSRLEKYSVCLVSDKPEEIEMILNKKKVDWLINTVCTYKENDTLFGDLLEANLIFPIRVFNMALCCGVKRYINIGTSLPRNLNMYSYTKHMFSDFCMFASKEREIHFADLQLEMFYGGENEPKDRLIRSCIEKLRKNEELLLTEGLQKRDIVRMEDVVSVLLRLIESDYLHGYRILPIGSGEHHSIRDIMQFMKEVTCSSSVLNFGALPSRVNEPDTMADISWYKDIHFSNKFSFFEGLRDMCEKSL